MSIARPARSRKTRSIRRAAALLLLIPGAAASAPTPSVWRGLERLTLEGVQLTIEANPDAGASPRLRLTGVRHAAIAPPGGLIPVAAGLSRIPGAPANALPSRWVYRPTGARPALVFGHGYETDPGSLTVVNVARARATHMEDTFALAALRVRDGGYVLTGRPGLAQMWDRCTAAYEPYRVLVVTASGQVRTDRAASRAYNLAHYVWAGPAPRADRAVDVCATPARWAAIPTSRRP